MFKLIPTLNNRGYQMATPSPLLNDWTSSYDGKHPLLDIGCAYGINTFKALELGIPTVSVDPEEEHLEILRQNLDPKYRHLSTCVKGGIPDNVDFPDNYFSGVLCAEVMHFLDGKTIERSFETILRKLVPKGIFVITMSSDKMLGYIDKDWQTKFYKDLENGIKWPGEKQIDSEFITKHKRLIQNEKFKSELDYILGDFFHFCSPKQLADELEQHGFLILRVQHGEHQGHPDPEGMGTLFGRNVFVVAQKMTVKQ